jgi:hypothetical protein
MRGLRLAFCLAVALAAATASAGLAADAPGKATGSLTVNGKSVKLAYAYARQVKGATMPDSNQFDLRPPHEGETAAEGIFLVLTDVPLPAADLTYVSSIESMLESGKVQGISWVVDGQRQALNQRLFHAALERTVPGSPDSFELSRSDAGIVGKASEADDFFDDEWSYEVTFDAPVAPLPTASMQAGTALGTVTYDGTTYELRHAFARTEPGSFDKSKRQVVLDLLDAPLPAKTLASRFEMMDLARAGKVHGVSVTIDADHDIISGSFYLPGLEMASSTGWQEFEAVAFDGKTIEGRVYSKGAHEILDHQVLLDVRFNVAPK